MMRIFGLFLGLVLSAQAASGALLVSYQFASSGAPTYNGVVTSTQMTASAFANQGTAGSAGISGGVNLGSWRTAANVSNAAPSDTRFNKVSLTNGTLYMLTIESLSAKLWKVAGTGNANVNVQYSVNGSSWSDFGATPISNSGTTAPSSNASLTLASPVNLMQGDTIDIRFQWYRTGTTPTTNQFRFDDLEISGSFMEVPEPASIATFGLISAGLLVTRRRKQS